MVRNIGMDMVGEGVETSAQVIALQDLGCDYAQGFFFSRALTPGQMRSFASRNLSLICHTQGALAYANQWNDRLTVFHAIEPTAGN
jgi:predicted signal transduction protein with EAL and GGDEF domain